MLRLHAQHVDQEAERAEVAGQAVEHAGLARRAAGSTSVEIRPSTSSRMRSSACDAWSMPSTDSTPRIADSWSGTGDQHVALSSGCGRTGRSASRPRTARRAAPARRCPSSGGRRRGGTAPPSRLRAARGARALAHRGEALRRGAARARPARDGRSRRPRATPRGRAGWSRPPSPAAPAARPPAAAVCATAVCSSAASDSPTGTAAAANRRPARTARPGRPGGASRRRPTADQASLARGDALARLGDRSPGRSGRAR